MDLSAAGAQPLASSCSLLAKTSRGASRDCSLSALCCAQSQTLRRCRCSASLVDAIVDAVRAAAGRALTRLAPTMLDAGDAVEAELEVGEVFAPSGYCRQALRRLQNGGPYLDARDVRTHIRLVFAFWTIFTVFAV